ncbi:MAG: hypothetical protein KDC05_00070 [Bacteroidales bacterium]|nr:hypothetical protein [Bacteroidales bacterium]
MKTIIGIIALFFAVSVTAYAQDKAEIKVSELPEAITTNLSDQHAGWEAVKAYKQSAMNGTTYEVIVKNDDQKMRFTYDERGRLLNKEPFNKDKDYKKSDDMHKKPQKDQVRVQ